MALESRKEEKMCRQKMKDLYNYKKNERCRIQRYSKSRMKVDYLEGLHYFFFVC